MQTRGTVKGSPGNKTGYNAMISNCNHAAVPYQLSSISLKRGFKCRNHWILVVLFEIQKLSTI